MLLTLERTFTSLSARKAPPYVQARRRLTAFSSFIVWFFFFAKCFSLFTCNLVCLCAAGWWSPLSYLAPHVCGEPGAKSLADDLILGQSSQVKSFYLYSASSQQELSHGTLHVEQRSVSRSWFSENSGFLNPEMRETLGFPFHKGR